MTRCLLLWAFGLRFLSADAAAEQREALVAAWNHRQNTVHSFHFEWSGTHFCAAGVGELPIMRQSEGKAAARSDLSCKTQTSLYVDGKGRFRVDCQGEIWSREHSAYVPQSTSNVLDGQFERSFSSKTISSDVPIGVITEGKASESRKVARYLPIMMAYRPFDTTMSCFDPGNLKMTTERGMVDGRSCMILQQRTGDYLRTVWVDAAREFVPVRYLSGRMGVTSIQVDVSYSKDTNYGWVPSSWSIALMDSRGGISESWDAIDVKYELNETIPESSFQLTYPRGTMVRNAITKETYLVLEEGEKRPILPGEYTGSNYHELLRGAPPSRGVGGRIGLALVSQVFQASTASLFDCWR